MTGLCIGFPPIADDRSRVLILGSMPGVESLKVGQYYANPRNVFWPIMRTVANAGPELAYEDRLARLKSAGIAIWDVLQSCVRPGSLDAAITDETPNDFAAFFAGHPNVRRVLFNGEKAETSFRKLVLPALNPTVLQFARLPSTSPAHARMNLDQKVAAWKVLIG